MADGRWENCIASNGGRQFSDCEQQHILCTACSGRGKDESLCPTCMGRGKVRVTKWMPDVVPIAAVTHGRPPRT